MKKTFLFLTLAGTAMSLFFYLGCSVETGDIYFPDGVTMENNDNYNKANMAFQQQRIQEGLQFLERAAQEGYRHPFVYARLAEQNGYLEKYSDALTYSKKTIDIIESDDIKVMFPNELAMFNKENRPRHVANMYSLHALILYELGEKADAQLFAQKAQTLFSNDPRSKDVIGKLAIDNGQYDKAIAIYRAFIQNSPKFSEAHFSLGRVLLLSGQTAEAKKELEIYLTRVPASHPNALEAKALLKQK